MKKQLLFTALLAAFLSFSQASLVKDINPGGGSSLPISNFEYSVVNNKLIFAAAIPSSNNYGNVWVSDGTTSGTSLLHQLIPTGDGYAQDFYYSNNLNKVIFMGNNGASNTFSVFVTDGTPSGLQSLSGTNYAYLNAQNNTQFPQGFTDFNGKVFFNQDQTNLSAGFELFSTDGTPSGTGLFKELRTGTFGGNPYEFTVFNNKLYFVSFDPTSSGFEIWVCDGTAVGTSLFIDINPGTANALPSELTVFNNKLYFTADNGTNGRELWTTDGTPGGTYMVLDLYSGSVGSNPTNLTVYNNALYFTATHATLGNEIFKLSTSETMTNLKNINAGNASSSPFNLFVYNSELYFAADDGNGVELWKSGGFNANTNKLIDINPTGESNPGNFCEYNGKLYFVADNGTNGRELWVTDGSVANTMMVADINPGSNSSNPNGLVVVNNLLLFAAQNASTGNELWKYQDPTLSVSNFELTGNEINLYPNPAKDYFELATNLNVEKVELYNLQGQLVKSFMNQNIYSTNELQNGMYLVKVFTDKGIVNKTIIKKD
ncbi:MAG: T9SS type A sorting domain-containing protein [Flavobacteriaceae bacterium]|nr:T9SS type A sorting domain-containing protein [Flavobacteriaceae bacterium]